MKIHPSFFLLTISLIFLDQLSKFLALWNARPVSLISPFCNKNIAWGIPIAPGVFYFIWIIIFFIMTYAFLTIKNRNGKIILIFILSGAISNMIDRIVHSCVIDFIDLKIWPAFNLADFYITMGAILLIIFQIKNSKHQIPNTKR